ncbi:MAG: ABC transporter substrate-binding protein/permease [Pirellulales bacterium]|nr:ABC transporter substrate-binding protein/permease [Pirellulales bacterium]
MPFDSILPTRSINHARPRRALAGLLLLLALAVSIRPAQADDDALRQRLAGGVLRWGGDAEGGAPYQLRDPDDPGRIIGFEVELVDALAARLAQRLGIALRADFVQYEWVSLPLGLERGDFDLIASGFESSPQRAKMMRLSRAYYIARPELAVRRGETRIRELADLKDKAVGTLSASAAQRVLEELPAGSIVGFDGQVEPYLDLELGRLDAVLLDGPISIYYGRPNAKLTTRAVDAPSVEYVLALRPADKELAAALDRALGEVIQTGELTRILRRWHLWNADQVSLAKGDAELAALGFSPAGAALPLLMPVAAVDVNMLASSARKWGFADYAPLLGRGALMTLGLSLASMALAITLGLLVCVARLYGPAPLRWAALAYVELFRGLPLLLLLFFLYFGLAHYGVDLPAVQTAIIGFGLTYAAYEAEIYRSAIQSMPRGQWEAALALGMSPALAFRRIIFPQALRAALAPMTNDFVALFKDTSLVSVIAVHELTKEYLILSRSSLKFVELGLLTAVLYLAMSIPLGYLSRWLEQRWGPAR